MKNKILVSGLLLLTMVSACQKHNKCKSYNSEIITENIIVDDFNTINLEMEADIIFRQGPNTSLEIEAPEDLISHIKTSVFQNKLTIGIKNNFCYFNKKTVKIYIESPEIEAIDIEGSGDFKVENKIVTEHLSVDISGSGNFYIDSLEAETLSGSISGSGDIYAAGFDTLTEQRIKISGSGDINLINIPSQKTTISISGSGNCKVYTINDLDVKISGSGDVVYKGSPQLSTSISGSGSIKHQ
ncbi:MAG: head GIN domain-containing protein [Crocinitomicaceae bacterium]